MRRHCCSALLFLAATACAAQTSVPPAQPTAPYTIKSATNRVLIDVVVKDKNGNPVHGLKQADFAVLENASAQDIKSFDEHSALPPSAAAAVLAYPKLPPGQFTNFVPVHQSSALTVILFDRLNTGLRDQTLVRAGLVDYLKHARPDARIAIYGLNSRLVLLQGFTSNPAMLLRALDDKSLTQASPLRDNVNGGGVGVEDLKALTDILGRDAEFAQAQAAVQAFQAQYQSFQAQIQGKITLDALRQIARSLSSVPGRKNLIWFAGNFPQALFPDDNVTAPATSAGAPAQTGTIPFGQFAGLEREYEDTTDLLAGGQFAIYPVDAQGLRTNNVNNAALSNGQEYGRIKSGETRLGLQSTVDLNDENSATGRDHLGADMLARDTGGEAFYNSNDLARAVDEAINAGSNYYTVAYSPSNPADKITFRKITVKVAGKDYKLSYRRGYYAGTTTPGKPAVVQDNAPSTALKSALLQGGPEPTEILLRVKAAPVDKGGDQAAAEGNELNPDANKSRGPYQSFQVDYATSMRAISIQKTSDNLFHANLDFIVYVYDGNGTLVNAQSNTFHGTFTAAELAGTLLGGLPFTQRISVPQSGEHFLRVVVHDNVGDKVGAVEIPVSVVKLLPIVAVSADKTPTLGPQP